MENSSTGKYQSMGEELKGNVKTRDEVQALTGFFTLIYANIMYGNMDIRGFESTVFKMKLQKQ